MSAAVQDKITKACELLSREARGFCIFHAHHEELYLTESIIEHEGPMSPLKFYREHVSKNVPLLIRNAISHWKAVGKWNELHFRRIMGNKEISVSVTPNGYADAVATDEQNKEYFVQPEERSMTISDFLDSLDDPFDDEVFYIQRQNSNFENEYPELWRDVEDLRWATEAFDKHPDAINFWMGDRRAVTSMHKDPYENIYCVVVGEKEFILHPPTDLPWIPYSKYPSAVYKKLERNKWTILGENAAEGQNSVPWISIDPLDPDYKRYPLYKNVNTLRVKVKAGDVLYLPSLWYHHVRQSHGCIAINYWYDMEYDIKYAYHLALWPVTRWP